MNTETEKKIMKEREEVDNKLKGNAYRQSADPGSSTASALPLQYLCNGGHSCI